MSYFGFMHVLFLEINHSWLLKKQCICVTFCDDNQFLPSLLYILTMIYCMSSHTCFPRHIRRSLSNDCCLLVLKNIFKFSCICCVHTDDITITSSQNFSIAQIFMWIYLLLTFIAIPVILKWMEHSDCRPVFSKYIKGKRIV